MSLKLLVVEDDILLAEVIVIILQVKSGKLKL